MNRRHMLNSSTVATAATVLMDGMGFDEVG
jgi:hypothetical protein